MGSNEEIVQPFSHTQTAHESCCLMKSCCDAPYPMTISRIWNRCVQDGNTEHSAGSQRPSSRKHRDVTRMASTNREATSRALSQESESFARQQMSARTVRRRLQQHQWRNVHPRIA
ncbi:hypothetical protein TNCV_1824941 [Trichonephila clavipes]|nr:hypothetical protein TNCV_1824941 [Trichonephila clavipes]